MSEYQFLAFRAVDRPLTDRELVYARAQSSRAQITRWHFENEYNYGDFSGDADGLLRHGYDVHLHYANFGIRKIAFRLPSGLPFPKSVWKNYLSLEGITWKKDSRGRGGILILQPYHEGDYLDEIWSPGDYLDDVVAIRNQLLVGDLHILYLIWLCAAADDDVSPDIIEPPVPEGLVDCVERYGAMMEFFGLDPLVLAAAAEGTPTPPAQEDDHHRFATWVDGLSLGECKRLLRKLCTEDATAVKAEMLAAFCESAPKIDRRTVSLDRMFGQLLERTEALRAAHDAQEEKKRKAAARRKAAKQERERQKRMKLMRQAPEPWLREADKLVAARGTQNYKAAAEILADLRDALGDDEGTQITHQHAAHLAQQYPTLTHLKSSLRKQGLLE